MRMKERDCWGFYRLDALDPGALEKRTTHLGSGRSTYGQTECIYAYMYTYVLPQLIS